MRGRQRLRHHGLAGRCCDLDLRLTAVQRRGLQLPALVRQDIDAHLRDTVSLEPEKLRPPARHVDDPPARERPPVVDPQDQRAAVFQVRDTHRAGHRQRAVRGRQVVLVVGLAVRRLLAVKARAVPGRNTGFGVFEVLGRVVPGTLDLVRRADLVTPAARINTVAAHLLGGMDQEFGLRAGREHKRAGQRQGNRTPAGGVRSGFG